MLKVRFRGPQALFAHAHLKAEPYSYDVLPPSTAKGMLRAIYWKPEFEWEIARIHVLKPIRRAVRALRVMNDRTLTQWRVNGSLAATDIRGLAGASVLLDVDYVVEARIVVNPHKAQRSAHAYTQEATRRMEEGQQFRALSFGRREYDAHYDLVNEIPEAIPVTRPLGNLPLDLVPMRAKKDLKVRPVFFRAQLDGGVLHVDESLYAQHRNDIWAYRNAVHGGDACSSKR
jgi:CRISPR-associated protein Cas5d